MLHRIYWSRIALTLACFCLGIVSALGQGRTDQQWLIGGTSLQFDDSLSGNLPNTATLGTGGTAVANDPVTGEIFFYADGATLYDAQGNTLSALGGDASTNQPVVIVPQPGDDAQDGTLSYYVFVNAGGTINRYTVTVTLSDEAASVALTDGPTATGITNAAEGMTVVPSEDNSNFWVVTQEAGSGNFQVINASDLSVNTYTIPENTTANNIAYSPANNQLAVATDNGVRIVTIDPASGVLTYNTNITGVAGAYDTEWSEDGSKLYISTGAGGNVFQYNFDNNALSPISAQVPGTANFGLQRAPDGSIYHLYQDAGGPIQLGRITAADSAASLIGFEANVAPSVGDFGGQQFSQSALSSVDLSQVSFQPIPVGSCLNNPVQLTPRFLINGVAQPDNQLPDPDSIVWLIDGQRFTGFSPTFIPESAPNVQAIAYWDGDSVATPSVSLSLQDFELQVPIVQDTTICPDATLELCAAPQDGGGQGGGGQQPGGGGGLPGTGGGGQGGDCAAGNYTYLWSTGATTPDITVDQAGVYWVLVTDPATGCTAYAESNVKEYLVENQTYNVWYFGDGAGIDFNTLYDDPENPDDNEDGEDNDGQITPIGDGVQNAPEGVEAVSDPNGDILFYTDGQTVWFVTKDPDTGERIPQEMPIADDAGATGIGGDPSATQVVAVQVPGTDAAYYIFTTTAVENGGYELRYSIVDLRGGGTQPGPAVVSSNNLLFVKSTERVAIQGGRGGNATLIVHEYGNNTFRAYPITNQGIGQPVLSSVGSVHSFDSEDDARGYIKFGGDSTGTVVAVALDDRVEVANFDNETLKLSNPVTIDFSGQSAQPYGVEFFTDSLGNTVLLVSTDNGLFTAKIDGPLEEGETINVTRDPDFSGNYGAIQRGPDGQIYVAQEGANSIIAVSVNGNTGDVSEGNSVELPDGTTSGLGLPSYINSGGNSFPEPNISVTDACVGNETNFAAQGRDESIETYSWEIIQILDNGTERTYGLPDSLRTAQEFTFTIDTTGNFRAEVTLSNICDQDTTLIQDFIMNTASEIILPASVNLCNGEVELTAIDPAEDDGSYTFEWVQIGAVGGGNLPSQNTIVVSEPTRYTVTVTNAEGCVSDGDVEVFDSRPPVDLPEDFTLCQGEERELDVEIPSPGDPGYEWDILDASGTSIATSNESSLEVSEITPDAGVYTYTVTITDDSEDACFVRDTVVVTILETPAVTGTVAQSTCGNQDGAITLQVTSDPAETYTFNWTNQDGTFTSTNQDIAALEAGVYTVTVTNSSGCSATENFAVEDSDADFDLSDLAVTESGCDDDEGTITFVIDNPGANTFNAQYILNGNGIAPITGTIPDVSPTVLSGLSAGSYGLTVTSAQGCVQSDTITILPSLDSLEFTFVQEPVQACDINAEITVNYNPATDGTWTFEWFREDGTPIGAPPNVASLTVVESGRYSVEVTNTSDPTICPSTREINVYLNDPYNINIEPVDPDNSCETGERQLTVDFIDDADADRDLIYNWSLDGVNLPLASRTITVTESGEYGVRVRERGSSCTANDSEPVVVNQPLSVNIFYTNTCADGRNIPLFASVRTEGTDSLRYEWYSPDGTRLPSSSDTLLVRPEYPEGEYRVEVTSLIDGATGCSAEASASLVRDSVPVTNLSNGPFIICARDPNPALNSAFLEVSPSPLISWFIVDENGNQVELANTTDYTATQGGTYYVTATNEFGCSVTDSVEVIEDCRPTIIAPNVFRPGGVNAEFFVYPRYVSTEGFDIKIYNRWGELVYQSSELDFRWDGTYNGRDVPVGSYAYVVRFRSDEDSDSNGTEYEERGGVTVLR